MKRVMARMRQSGYLPEEELEAVAGSSIAVVTPAPFLMMPSSGPLTGRSP
jgi:hypothetical protein